MYVSLVLVLTTLLGAFIFYSATKNSRQSLMIILIWLAIQSAIALTGLYQVTKESLLADPNDRTTDVTNHRNVYE